jgi:amidase
MPGDPYFAPPPARPFLQEVGADPGRLRVGVLASLPERPVHPDCAAAARDAGKLLASLGHAVEESHPKAFGELEFTDRFMTIVTSWTAATLDDWSRRTGETVGPDGVEPATWTLAEMGRAHSAPKYVESILWLQAWARRMASWWADGFDLLVTPTIGEPPPRLGELVAPPEDPLATMPRLLAMIPFTPPFNVTGQPAISLPLSWNDDGLPIGVQLVAAYGREDLLLRVAAALERARPWSSRRPPIFAGD